jgi:glycerol-3-phosphate cytidylyltransferase-like family protein
MLAKSFGDYLIVNIAPDSRAKKKGENRPILSLEERMFIVNNLRVVDEVVSIEDGDDYQIKCLREIKPDVFIVKRHNDQEALFCRENNIKYQIVMEIPSLTTLHTTDIINKIKQ